MSFDNIILVLVCLAVALLLARSKKQQSPEQKEKDNRAVFPWWYYSSLGIAFLLTMGPFKGILKTIGWILFALIIGIGFNWQLKRK